MEKKKIFKITWTICVVSPGGDYDWKRIEAFRTTKSLAEDLAREVEAAGELLGYKYSNRIKVITEEVEIL